MKLSLFVLVAFLAGLATFANAQVWVHSFTPIRVRYAAPNANGSGTPSSPMSLASAISTANPGDLIWLRAGTYIGQFRLSRAGTATRPIVFRARPGANVVIDGALEISGAHTWVWGLEITDPTNRGRSQDSGVRITAAGVHLINNVIHHHPDKNGIAAWNSGPGQVIYGNVVYQNGEGPNHPHNIYSQNDFNAYGWKYIVDNVLLDSADVCDGCFNFHAYTEGGFIRGFHLEGNVISNGRFLIGGYNVPADREVVLQNYFYQSRVQFGYARPTQVEFRNNYLGRSTLDTQWFWGAGETRYSQPRPNVYTGNQFHRPAGRHVMFRTAANLASGPCEGCPRIRSVDVFDSNTYSSPFSASFFAANNNPGTVTLPAWRTASTTAGKAFDVNSSVVAAPTTAKVVLIPNDYEPGRAHLAIYNWGRANQVSVNLSPVVPAGAYFSVYPAKDVNGSPAVSGSYNGPVPVPLAGDEFAAFVVVSRSARRPPRR